MRNKFTVLLCGLVSLMSASLVSAAEVTGQLGSGLETGITGTLITAPTASVAAGTFTSNQSVTLSASGASSIHYTTDGTTPTCTTGSTYGSAITISASTDLKARACYPNSNSSTVATFAYALQCATASVSNGSVSAYPTCTISCNSGYSLSGSSCNANAVSSGGGGGGGGGTLPPSQPAQVVPPTVIYSPISSPAPTLPAPTQTPTKKVASISADILNVRGLPGTTGKVLGKVTKGAKFTILDESKGWYKVEFKKGVTGWVAANYVKTNVETLSLATKPAATPSVTIVNAVSVNVRSIPSIKGKILGKVTKGSKFAIVETGSGWYKVEFKKGVKGWVSASYAVKK